MHNLRCTIYGVRCTILKFSILIHLFICCSSISAQNFIEQDSVQKTEPFNIHDSLFSNSSETKIKLKYSPKKNDTTALAAPAEKGKIKKQKKIDTTHYSPKKAAIWAAGFPGLGQIYMKKYWKLPIVYAAIGAVLYFVVSNGQNLKKYNGYIRNVYDSIPNPAPYDRLDISELETYRNSYRKNLQIASFGTVFVWGLSIIDAVVDAHLHSFDVSDKLTMRIKPQINYSNFTYYSGIGVNLGFK